MVSGAGRRVTRRSDSARRRRGDQGGGVESCDLPETGPDQLAVAHRLEGRGVPGDDLVHDHPVGEREAGGLAGDDRGLPLGDAARPPGRPRVRQLAGDDLGQSEVLTSAVRRLPPGPRHLVGHACSLPGCRDTGVGLGGALRLVELAGEVGLGRRDDAPESLERPERVDALGVVQAARGLQSGGQVNGPRLDVRRAQHPLTTRGGAARCVGRIDIEHVFDSTCVSRPWEEVRRTWGEVSRLPRSGGAEAAPDPPPIPCPHEHRHRRTAATCSTAPAPGPPRTPTRPPGPSWRPSSPTSRRAATPPTSPTGSPARWSSARPGCAARSGPGPTG